MPPIGEDYAAYPRNYGPGSFDPGPRHVRIEAIGEAWRLLNADWATWVLATLCLIGVSIVASTPVFVYSLLRRGLSQADAFDYPPEYFAALAVGSCFSQFLMGIASDGFIYLALRRHRGEMAPFGDAFKYGGRFGSLATAEAILCPLALVSVLGGFLARNATTSSVPFDRLYAMSGGQILGSLTAAAIFALAVFVPLLVLDQGMSPAEAFRSSFQAAGSKFLPIVGLLIVAAILSGVGCLACFVGGLFTFPIQLATKAVLYHDFFRPKVAPVAPPPQFGSTPPGAWS